MRTLIVGAAIAAALTVVGTAAGSSWPPEPAPTPTTAQAVRLHPRLRAQVAHLPASTRAERGVELGRDELHQGAPSGPNAGRVVWARVRAQAVDYLAATHPDADWALRRAYSVNGDLLYVARRVWRRAGVPEWRVAFYSCAPLHEGGLDVMDRWNGPGHNWRGWETGVLLGFVWTNRVVDPWQPRPAWFRGYRDGHPGKYLLPDVWDRDLFALATDPVAAADMVRYLDPGQWDGPTLAACT